MANIPYFNRVQGIFSSPQLREVDALQRGEIWTRQGLINHARYMGEYTKEPGRQAAWLMGLAACIGNDEHTASLLQQAIRHGLSLEDAAHLAVYSDSHAATVTLSSMGVDWTKQQILAKHPELAGQRTTLDQPVQVFMEQAMQDPPLVQARYATQIEPQLALDIGFSLAHQGRRVSGFLQGILDSGVDCQARAVTPALGLASGQACVLSMAIANRSWDLVDQWLKQDLSQDTKDEALLACAMSLEYFEKEAREEVLSADLSRWEWIVGKLISDGANADAVFSFADEANKTLHGFRGRPENQIHGTTRQWFLHGVMGFEQSQGLKWQPWLCPLPLPARDEIPSPAFPKYWCQWLTAKEERESRGLRGSCALSGYLRFFLAHQPVPIEDARELLGEACLSASLGGFFLLDAMLDTPDFPLLGSFSRQEFLSVLKEVCGGLEDPEEPDGGIKTSIPLGSVILATVWNHPRLELLTRLLTEDEAQNFREQMAPFHALLQDTLSKRSLNAPFVSPFHAMSKLSAEDVEVLDMALQASLSGFEAGVSLARKARRTL